MSKVYDRSKALKIMEQIKRPTTCEKCEGVMVYRGLGEYQCEDCGECSYDDYGKVRNYLETHKGATVAAIADVTGVTRKSIRDMVKENRFEVVENRAHFLTCEMCGADIKSGRLCPKCEMQSHRQVEAEVRAGRKKNIEGHSQARVGEEGSKRFTRS